MAPPSVPPTTAPMLASESPDALSLSSAALMTALHPETLGFRMQYSRFESPSFMAAIQIIQPSSSLLQHTVVNVELVAALEDVTEGLEGTGEGPVPETAIVVL